MQILECNIQKRQTEAHESWWHGVEKMNEYCRGWWKGPSFTSMAVSLVCASRLLFHDNVDVPGTKATKKHMFSKESMLKKCDLCLKIFGIYEVQCTSTMNYKYFEYEPVLKILKSLKNV